MKRNPIQRSSYIDSEYRNYLKCTFKFGDDNLQKLFEEQLDKEELFRGPYVDLNLPFKRGKSIKDLINEGVICKSFFSISDVDFDRPLYFHQEKAIRHIKNNRSAIITTGTGSGKTECFLFPILNDILENIEKGNNEVGIRAIFLYPMNALVIDQIERVRSLLKNTPKITFGFFTGETPEKRLESSINSCTIENELISREEIRANPPHLLFTNYSMLEYLLIRPNDYSIFEPNRLKNWKYVVLDEAHSYSGAQGIEISMLMRRLTGLAKNKPNFILTSATLGQKNKSENEIIKFANNLTSINFSINDIIFADRIPFEESNSLIKINSQDYLNIKENLNNISELEKILKKYDSEIKIVDKKSALYSLLKKDSNVLQLYSFLKDKSKSIDNIINYYKNTINPNELSALIDLINIAENNKIGLFDLKYHSFVRPLNGAYITGDKKRLSLTKTNNIDGFKAFEIGNCRFCNAPFIIGKIFPDPKTKLNFLLQNSEVDIYENYGNNKNVTLDYFLLSDKAEEQDDFLDNKPLEEFILCSKCGAIYEKDNLNARKCECDEINKFSIYKVDNNKRDKNKQEAYNNINECPCCRHKSYTGIVKNLNLGKDEGTSIIARLLIEALDEKDYNNNPSSHIKKFSLKNNYHKTDSNTKDNYIQFLTFSDSRQQASFAAVFFDSTYTKLIQKRIVWKVLEMNNYESMSVERLASLIKEYIKENNLLTSTKLSAEKNAWVTILIDLLKIDGSYDPEGLGLYYYELDLHDVENALKTLDDQEFKDYFEKYNLKNRNDIITLIKVIFDVFRTTPAINYSISGLTEEDKFKFLEFRRFDNSIIFKNPSNTKNSNNIRSFLPIKKGAENIIVRYVKKVCSCDQESSKDLLDIIFNKLILGLNSEDGYEPILKETHNNSNSYKIDINKYIIKNYKTSKFYKCSKCSKLTPYNLNNKCIKDKCDGLLEEVDPDLFLKSNAYRKQYKSNMLRNIIIKEHTAQINRKIAKEYQDAFKNKKINILSCSTTFEMGVDIGNLDNVFMRNVPPTPANYVQRAGRAGRRKGSSAYILTYCGTGSHDYTYFLEPEKMVSGLINPPYFDVLNKKIIIRHLMAACLGAFFRKYPEYFESIDNLVFKDGLDKFNNYLNNHPNDLNKYINEKVLPGENYEYYHNFKWFDDMKGNDEKLAYLVQTLKEIDNEYKEAQEIALIKKEYKEAGYFEDQIEKLHKGKNTIELLSDFGVIPKYGFPVDVVDLKVYQNGFWNSNIDLSRDLKIAISEYAPDSEVIADGKKYTSRYITFPKKPNDSYPFLKNYFVQCKKCNKVNVFKSAYLSNCKYCGDQLNQDNYKEFYIEPIYGFKSGQSKETTRLKPRKSYAGEINYLGGGRNTQRLEISDSIIVETSTDDELLIINKSYFYMCPLCGYSEIYKTGSGLLFTKIKISHKNYREFTCNNEDLTRIRIGHSFKTDVTRFIIPSLISNEENSFSKAMSFLYAFIEGVSLALEIDRNDIDGILENNLDTGSYDVLLYDNVPGGAGHVKRLLDKKAVLYSLEKGLEKVSQTCCDSETSCYNCLRSYYNQMYHNKLVRGLAKEFIENLLNLLKDSHNINELELKKDLLGSKKLEFIKDLNDESIDSVKAFETLLEYSNNKEEYESFFKRMIELLRLSNYEKAYIDTSIPMNDDCLWPELFWPKSKVALFLPEQIDSYKIMKNYNWFCYLISNDTAPEDIIKHVKVNE